VARVVAESDEFGQSGPGDPTLDPQREYTPETIEILRCCLVRTLYNYSGQPTNEGGAELRPDLATGLPIVSAGGLVWTFHIKAGLHYAPPLATTEIVSQDFVRSLKREARVTMQDGGEDYALYYFPIRGFAEYANGKSDTISGLATPDPHTLVVTLTQRVGDLPDRFVLPGTSPIPAAASSPDSAFGIATGHDAGFGGFIAATGPYMYAGADRLMPDSPAADQKPAEGFAPKRSTFELVRNPSWDSSSDDLRPAYPDRIDITLVPTLNEILKRIDDGRADVMLWNAAPPLDFPRSELLKYQDDPALGRLIVSPRDEVRYASMNMATPPFDDVHVRKALNYIVDKRAYISNEGGPLLAAPATHVIIDPLEDNQLVDYDPYRSSGSEDALAKAEAEMRLSKYDIRRDGTCGAPPCKGVKTYVLAGFPVLVRAARSFAADAARIGIDLSLVEVRNPEMFFGDISDPTRHIALGLAPGWNSDYINASNFVIPLFASPHVSKVFAVPGGPPGTFNYALVGASPASLRQWGYSVTDVPSADGRINQCLSLTGPPQVQCWAGLDEYLMEQIVPWVPLVTENEYEIVPKQVVDISMDQFLNVPSLDRIVVRTPPSGSRS
jgi:peptide/nickel transport system substrate-binding protein